MAIAFAEPEREDLVRIIEASDRSLTGTVSVVESRMVAVAGDLEWSP